MPTLVKELLKILPLVFSFTIVGDSLELKVPDSRYFAISGPLLLEVNTCSRRVKDSLLVPY